MSKLLSCPFCGNTEAVRCLDENEVDLNADEVENPEFLVVCCFGSGGCGASGGYRKTRGEAIAVWNRRKGE